MCSCVDAVIGKSELKAGRCKDEEYYCSEKRETVIGHSTAFPLTPIKAALTVGLDCHKVETHTAGDAPKRH